MLRCARRAILVSSLLLTCPASLSAQIFERLTPAPPTPDFDAVTIELEPIDGFTTQRMAHPHVITSTARLPDCEP